MNNDKKKNKNEAEKAKTKKAKVRTVRTAAQRKQRFTQIVVFVMIGTLLFSGLVAGISSSL